MFKRWWEQYRWLVWWGIQHLFRKPKTPKKSLPNFYEQSSKNAHFHLIQIYKFKIWVQFRMAYHFQIALCARKYTVNKKIPERWGQKTLWVCTTKTSVTSVGSDSWRKWRPWKQVVLKGGRSQIWWWRIGCIVRPMFPGIVFKDKRRKVDLLWGDGREELVEAVHVVDFVLQSWDRKGGKKPCWHLWTKCWMNKINSLQIPLVLDIDNIVELLQEVRVQMIVLAGQGVKIY